MVIMVMAHGSMVTWLQADLEQVILVIHRKWGVTGIISTMSICESVLSLEYAVFLVALKLSHDLSCLSYTVLNILIS